MKKFFDEVFDSRGISRNYFQHKDYKNITIPKDVFEDMTDEEVENFVNQTINDVNKDITSVKKPIKKQRSLTPDEISTAFAELRKQLGESFKEFYFSRK